MNESKRSRRDFIQNITIAVLTVSAVLLFVQTQVYNLGASSTFSRLFSGPDAQAVSVIAPQQEEISLCAPVRVAVASTYGRYGNIAMTTEDEDFLSLRQLLAQALGSAHNPVPSGSQAFLSALSSTSVYYDFLAPLPLSVLGELSQASVAEEQISAWHLVIAEENNAVFLHLWDGGTRYYRSTTALSTEDLQEVVGFYEVGNAFFAYESSAVHAQSAFPCSLFLEDTPALPVLSASSPLSDTTLLLVSLKFNPNTQNRYRDSDGTEVISESNNRTLRIGSDGTVEYQSEEDPTLSIESKDSVPTLAEAAFEVNRLLSSLLTSSGDARIYLEAIQQNGDSTSLRFGYQVGGVPVRLANGQSAAVVTLSGTAISSMTLHVRQYAITEHDSLLLPLRQALAIAANTPDTDLSIGYVDRNTDSIKAIWLAD